MERSPRGGSAAAGVSSYNGRTGAVTGLETDLTMSAAGLVGRSSGAGASGLVTVGSGLSLAAGVLSATGGGSRVYGQWSGITGATTAGTWATVQWTTSSLTGGMGVAGTTSRFQVPSDGVYLVTASVAFDGAAGVTKIKRGIRFFRNMSLVQGIHTHLDQTQDPQNLSLSFLLDFVAGDSVWVDVYSDIAENLVDPSFQESLYRIVKVSP